MGTCNSLTHWWSHTPLLSLQPGPQQVRHQCHLTRHESLPDSQVAVVCTNPDPKSSVSCFPEQFSARKENGLSEWADWGRAQNKLHLKPLLKHSWMEKSTREDASPTRSPWDRGVVAGGPTPHPPSNLVPSKAMVEATVSQGHSHHEGQLQGHHISRLSPSSMSPLGGSKPGTAATPPPQWSRCVDGGSVEGIVTMALNFAL